MQKRIVLVVTSLAILAAACSGTNAGGDDDGGDDADDVEDDAIDEGVGDAGDGGGFGDPCTTMDECGTEFPICSEAGACVGCETSDDCAADAPVCSNGTCSASCATDSFAADFVEIPSDIIWVVDQSGSMDQETEYVQSKINDFAAAIDASDIDYRVVMIAQHTQAGENAICVPAPLANGSCGNNTRFRVVNELIDSRNGPSRFISRYNAYSDFLRPDAMKHIIFVTDDNSDTSASSFTTGLAGLMPAGMFSTYNVHAIYAYGNGMSNGCTGPFGSGETEGTVYTTLVADSGGARGVICEDDWTAVLTDIEAAVVSGSQLSCELAVPTPTDGQTLDPMKVNVTYQAGGAGAAVTLSQVPDAAACTPAGGWYYDNNAAPTTITLCPATCTSVEADPDGNVTVQLGCETQVL
jgi:hypothetical protein